MEKEAVFKALADETRRRLLDKLFQQDGQTLTELCDNVDMTRHGVMKHLRILEEAELISTQKVGRERHHYINPVPIQLIYDRWVSKYAQPWAQSLVGLKQTLEDEHMSTKPNHVHQIFIRTTAERLWQALTDGELTKQYYLVSRVESSWEVGADYRYVDSDGHTLIQGVVLEIDPPRRLVTTFNAMWLSDGERGAETTVTYEIELVGGLCKLTMTHENLDPSSALTPTVQAGWAQVLSGLKTLLETGKPLQPA